MVASLSPYQIAALQEMGICVWQHQAELSLPAVDDKTSLSLPQSNQSFIKDASKDNRIAQLRSAAGRATENKAKEKQPKTLSLDSMGQIGDDLKLAFGMLKVEPLSWFEGTEVSVTASEVVLPVDQGTLSPVDKKRVWQALCTQRPKQ